MLVSGVKGLEAAVVLLAGEGCLCEQQTQRRWRPRYRVTSDVA
jgi:hypothetical protein